DPANLVPDNQFQSNGAWNLPSGPFALVASSAGNIGSIGAIRYDGTPGTGWTAWRRGKDFSVDRNKEYYGEARAFTGGGNQYSIQVQVMWVDSSGADISGSIIAGADINTGNTTYTNSFTAPSTARKAYIRYRVNQDNTN